MTETKLRILLTGASGIVGQALLKHLADDAVSCLIHRQQLDLPAGCERLHGDILLHHLGLSPEQYDSTINGLDWVIHCAAETNFSQTEEEMFRVNMDGTRNVLKLARDAGAKLCHVSTAFVRSAGKPGGLNQPLNAYGRSKAAAEALVGESSVPSMIVRPSRIIGDSRSGVISRFQGFHLLFDMLLRPEALIARASPEACVDFVPVDSVAEAIALLIHKDRTGSEYWITAGEHALSLRRTIDIEIEEIERLTGRKPTAPAQISAEEYESEVKPLLFTNLPKDLHPMLDGFIQMMDSLNETPFPSSYAELTDLGLKPMPDPATTLRRNIVYWARKRGLVRLSSARLGFTS